jgi:hypothetical protein
LYICILIKFNFFFNRITTYTLIVQQEDQNLSLLLRIFIRQPFKYNLIQTTINFPSYFQALQFFFFLNFKPQMLLLSSSSHKANTSQIPKLTPSPLLET